MRPALRLSRPRPAAIRTTLVVLLGSTALAAAPAHAEAKREGAAIVVDGAGSSKRLASGGSAAQFSLRLPSGAECPADSRDGSYRVQSFLIPAAVDVGSVQFGPDSADAPGSVALYDLDTVPFVQGFTAKARTQGGPGAIEAISTFSFAVFSPGDVGMGKFHMGIACTLFNVPTRYWDTEVTLTADGADRPAGFRWSAQGSTTTTSQKSPRAVLLFGVAVAVAVVALVAVLRRPERQRPSVSRAGAR